MNLLIYKYNNYYNRIVKRGELVEEYGDPIHVLIDCYDFTPNDGVNTEHIFGSTLEAYDGSGDYILLTDERNNILSRWFIIETRFNKHGQWRIQMRRDLVADFYDEIITSPCFIEKATLANGFLLYNEEDMTFNKIKKSETFLKDETGVAWIVGYYSRKPVEGKLLTASVEQDVAYDIAIPTTYEQWVAAHPNYVNTEVIGNPRDMYWQVLADANWFGAGLNENYLYTIREDSASVQDGGSVLSSLSIPRVYSPIEVKNMLLSQSFIQTTRNEIAPFNADAETMRKYNNKTLRFSDGVGGYEYYNYTISEVQESNFIKNLDLGTMRTAFDKQLLGPFGEYSNKYSYSYGYSYSVFTGSITPLSYNRLTIEILDDTTNKLDDAGYGMFALPFPTEKGINFTIKTDTTLSAVEVSMDQSKSLQIAMALALQNGEKVFDLQLLPYCPCREIIQGDGTFNCDGDEGLYTLITDGDNNPVGFILHASKSSFTLDLAYPLKSTNIKMENQTDTYRLCSPNFNGQFEFNLAKNGGFVPNFNADCTYLPYNPYIHINPWFGGLYGQDFNDSRGLICGGDFSLPVMSDAWQNYQIQNKNYQNIFNREVQSMELKNKVGRTQDIVTAITGSIQGTVSGAAAGGMMGNAVAGAIVGGVAATAGGVADVMINEALRNDALDYTKDMFGYQLGNIQALPQNITKTTAYTYNNKIFPILEYYSCSEEEKKAFAQKIAYNGMSVGTIGTIKDYLGNEWEWQYEAEGTTKTISSKGYIKGSLIRIEGLEDEYHLLKNISDEIYKGVYF